MQRYRDSDGCVCIQNHMPSSDVVCSFLPSVVWIHLSSEASLGSLLGSRGAGAYPRMLGHRWFMLSLYWKRLVMCRTLCEPSYWYEHFGRAKAVVILLFEYAIPAEFNRPKCWLYVHNLVSFCMLAVTSYFLCSQCLALSFLLADTRMAETRCLWGHLSSN